MKVYRGTDGDLAPVEQECEKFGFPNRTTTGETMYNNTHFKTIEEAWDSILKSVEAGINLSGKSVQYAEGKLQEAKNWAAKMAAQFAVAHDNYRQWKMKKKEG